MKRVIITGANSYIGTNVEKWLMKETEKYYVETLDMINPNWEEFYFGSFDVVFHVAGIAHVSTKKNMEDLYYRVNRDLTIKTAEMAKKAGVNQFIFMSSMIVYNPKETMITKETAPNPDNFYGKSKLEAEEAIMMLSTEKFKVTILRPPMIYGPMSKGNFIKLYRFASKTILFPKFKNKRSMLFINNLSEFVKNVIDYNLDGIYFPQNKEIVSSTEVVLEINRMKNRKILMTSLLNPILIILRKRVSIFNKMFSDSYYVPSMSNYKFVYQIETFSGSILILGKNDE